VIVTHEDSVSKQEMLEKLQKVRSHDKGGSVCLMSIFCFFIFLFWLYFFHSGHRRVENPSRLLSKKALGSVSC
jgi:hypothetical protein